MIKRSRKIACAFLLGVLGLALIAGFYYQFVYRPEQMKALNEQARPEQELYEQAGLSDEQAGKFISRFPEQNGNSTWVSFAKVWAENPDLAEKSWNAFKSVGDALRFVDFVKSHSYDGLGFLRDFPQFRHSYEVVLPAYSANASAVKVIYDRIQRDGRINVDKNRLFIEALKNYNELNILKGNVLIPTIHAVNNLTIAYLQEGLPKHVKETVWLLTNATQVPGYGEKIVDFSPIVVKDFEGKTHVIQSNKVARDTWMIAEHLRRTPYVVKHPELYEAFGIKVQQNAFDILDNPKMYRVRYFKPEEPYWKPSDEEIWSKVIIPQWEYHWSSAPQSGNFSKRITIMPWYDSELLKEWISDSTDRKIALTIFWELPLIVADLDEWLDRKYPFIVHRYGLEAMAYAVENMPRLYDEVMSRYLDKLRLHPLRGDYEDYQGYFYGGIDDRADWGLFHAAKQFLGTDIDEIPFHEYKENTTKLMLQFDSINTYLYKNFKYWDLLVFIDGYGVEYGGRDIHMDFHYYPIVYKAFGLPYQLTRYSQHYINAPERYAAGYDGAILGLPDSVVKPLKGGIYGEVLIPPGNLVDPLSIGLAGVKKDYEIGRQNPVQPNLKYLEAYLTLRGNTIYFFKIGERN